MLCASSLAAAREYHGQVFFNGVPVPGATVTVTQDGKRFSAVTDRQGLYEFADLADGAWKIEIEMRGFATLDGKVTVAGNQPQGNWELKLLNLAEMLAQAQVAKPLQARPAAKAETAPQQPAEAQSAAPPPEESNEQAADGLLINGSQNNAATSQFNLSPAFGNRRPGTKGLYNGSIGAIADNAVFDARPYSLAGQQTPKDAYSRITMMVALGGPLRIPHLLPNGPNFFVAYQWTRNADAANQTGLVPTTDERSGNLAGLLNAQGQPVTIYNPATGLPVTGIIPVSAQATALLNLYPQPLPSLAGNSRYNYQAEVLNDAHVDALQSRLNKTIGHRDQLYGGFGFRTAGHQTCSSNSYPTPDRTIVQCWGPRPDKGPGMWRTTADSAQVATLRQLPTPDGSSSDERNTLPVLPPEHVLRYDDAKLSCAVDDKGTLACRVGDHGFILAATETKLF